MKFQLLSANSTCDVKAPRSALKTEEHYEEEKQTQAGTRARTYKKKPTHTKRQGYLFES